MQIRQQLSRADLVRCLKQFDTEEDQALAAELLGYELPKVRRTAISSLLSFAKELSPQPILEESDQDHEPLLEIEQRPPAIFYALTEREVYKTDNETNTPSILQGVEPLQEADLQPWNKIEPLLHQSILPKARFVPFVHRSLQLEHGHYLDVPKLVKKIARLQVLQHLPKAPRQVVSGHLYVLLDASQRMRLFWDDLAEVANLIQRHYGRVGLEIRLIEACPPTRYQNWLAINSYEQEWQRFTTPCTVLLLSDLGQLASEQSSMRQQWLRFARNLKQQGCRVYALSPISPEQQDIRFHPLLRQVLWNRQSQLKPQLSTATEKSHAAKVARVLGLISIAVHVEPELLRALLQCLPANEADSGVEAVLYQHPDVNFGLTAISLKAEKRAQYQALFQAEEIPLQQQVIALLYQQHISQFPAVWAEEVLMLQNIVSFALPEAKRAQDFMLRFTRQFYGQSQDTGMRQFAKRHLQRLGAKGEHSHMLYGLAYREELRQGQTIPAGFDARVVQAIVQQATAKTEYFLVQLGEELWLKPLAGWSKDYPLSLQGSPLAALTLETSLLTLKQGEIHRTLPVQTERALWVLEEGSEFELETGRERLRFIAITKPAWATRIWRNAMGLFAGISWHNEEMEIVWQPSTNSITRGYWKWPRHLTTKEFTPLVINLNNKADIFIGYSHVDKAWKNEIQKHLSVLQLHGGLSIWDDRQIEMGDAWLPSIEAAINAARVAILLVSADFLTSNFIVRQEITKFLERRKAEGLKIIPIILHPCTWSYVTWLANLQSEIPDNKPLSSYPMGSHACDEVIMRIVEKVDDTLKEIDTLSTAKAFDSTLTNFSSKTKAKKQIEQPLIETWHEYANFMASFQPIVFPYETEPEWGVDQYGLWQALSIRKVRQVFRWIQAGRFWMGSPEHEKGRFDDEDYHQVILKKGFWLGETPVTQAFYEAVMYRNPSHFKGEQLPVEMISWKDTQVFLAKLNSLYPKLYARLPYEAEWEYACRASTKTPFHFGQVISLDLVNYSGTWNDFDDWDKEAKQATNTIKSYPPNAWGLYDMHGNVWEWCEDIYRKNLGTRTANNFFKQPDSSLLTHDLIPSLRVLRGGAWNDSGTNVRSAIRTKLIPTYYSFDISFRLVLNYI